MTTAHRRDKKKKQLVASVLMGALILSSGSYLVGSEVNHNENWNGITYIKIPDDFDLTVQKMIESRKAESITIYGYDYRIPELDGILLYTSASNGVSSKPPDKAIPDDQYASRIDKRWSNDLRKIPSLFELEENGKPYTEISVSIPIVDVSVPAGRAVIKLARRLSEDEKKDISDQMTTLARQLRIL